MKAAKMRCPTDTTEMPDEEQYVAYFGTDKTNSAAFDMAQVGSYSIGLHFGTYAVAKRRVEYLHKCNPLAPSRILTCALHIENPFHIDGEDFGHSYAGFLGALDCEAVRQDADVEIFSKISACTKRWMCAKNDFRYVKDSAFYRSFNLEMNDAIRNMFMMLGYDSLVYEYDMEDCCATDFYVVFDGRQVKIIGDEIINWTDAL